MPTMYDLVLYMFLFIFLATAIITLLAVIRCVRIDPRFLNWLFFALIGEVVASVLALGNFALTRYETLDQSLTNTVENLNDMLLFSQSCLNEPSDITSSDLKGCRHVPGPFALAVDDDEPYVFIVRRTGDDLSAYKTLHFGEIQPPEDLEAITWDQDKWYYASTSFRKFDDPSSLQLLRFEVKSRAWIDDEYRLTPEVRNIAEPLYDLLNKNGIEIDRKAWAEKTKPSKNLNEDWHPYEIEMEALAVRNETLLLGLKWPLDSNGHALLAEYSWKDKAFTRITRLDLAGAGISGLSFDIADKVLFVVANPPAKVRKLHFAVDVDRLCGKTIVYKYDWPLDAETPQKIAEVRSLARPRAKLEGLAKIDNEVWVTYDGPNHGLDWNPQDELSP